MTAGWWAAALERGRFDGFVARGLAAAWARVAEQTLLRRLALPERARVVTIGGSTLGGSGKTPLAIACAAELAAMGARVALVGHAYRAHPGRARVVDGRDALADVGDEALLAARALAPAGARVIVAPRRSQAIALASRHADVLVLDGIAQTAPVAASLALLAVDADRPWGAGRLPPCGDLRAPKDALLRACDAIVSVGERMRGGESDRWPESTLHARSRCPGVRVGGELRTWGPLADRRLGLLCALARTDRIVHGLRGRGIEPRAVVCAVDHGPLDARFFERAAKAQARAGIEMWLATPKCALHLERRRATLAPIGVLEHALTLCAALRQRLLEVVALATSA